MHDGTKPTEMRSAAARGTGTMHDTGEREERYGSFLSVFPSVMLPMFLAVADQTVVAAALPAIAGSVGGIERVSWIVIAYLLAATIAAPVYGQLRDILGSRRMMIIALAVFMGASILCSLSTSMEMLAFGRALQGLGGGGLMTVSQALIGESVAPRERARYQGWLASIAVTASVAGPVIGGILAEHVGWRSIFLVNLPLGLLALALVLRIKSSPLPTEAWSVDGLGLVYFTGFILPVLLGVELLQQLTPLSLFGAAILVALGIGSLVLLLRQEKVAHTPLLRLELLTQPAIWRSAAMVACHGAAMVSLITWLPVYFRVRFGTSAAESGAFLIALMVGLGSGSMLTGRLVNRTGLTMIFPCVGLSIAVLLLNVLSLGSGRLTVMQTLVLLFLLGLSMGTVMTVVQLTVQRVAGRALLGAAAASIQFSRSVGAAVGTAIVGTVLFASLALSEPMVSEMFRAIVQEGPQTFSNLPASQQAMLRTELSHTFGIVFFFIALFTATALALAWSHPERRL